MLVNCVIICFFFFLSFKADKIKDTILKKAPSTCNLSSFKIPKKKKVPKEPKVLSTNPTTTEEVTQSSQDFTPTQKAHIDFSILRKWKLPTLDENEKSDQKKNVEPKPKQTKLLLYFSKNKGYLCYKSIFCHRVALDV